jgi:hypothetical protein
LVVSPRQRFTLPLLLSLPSPFHYLSLWAAAIIPSIGKIQDAEIFSIPPSHTFTMILAKPQRSEVKRSKYGTAKHRSNLRLCGVVIISGESGKCNGGTWFISDDDPIGSTGISTQNNFRVSDADLVLRLTSLLIANPVPMHFSGKFVTVVTTETMMIHSTDATHADIECASGSNVSVLVNGDENCPRTILERKIYEA